MVSRNPFSFASRKSCRRWLRYEPSAGCLLAFPIPSLASRPRRGCRGASIYKYTWLARPLFTETFIPLLFRRQQTSPASESNYAKVRRGGGAGWGERGDARDFSDLGNRGLRHGRCIFISDSNRY